MVKIGREKSRPNTLVSAASVRGRTLADKVYSTVMTYVQEREALTSFYAKRKVLADGLSTAPLNL